MVDIKDIFQSEGFHFSLLLCFSICISFKVVKYIEINKISIPNFFYNVLCLYVLLTFSISLFLSFLPQTLSECTFCTAFLIDLMTHLILKEKG